MKVHKATHINVEPEVNKKKAIEMAKNTEENFEVTKINERMKDENDYLKKEITKLNENVTAYESANKVLTENVKKLTNEVTEKNERIKDLEGKLKESERIDKDKEKEELKVNIGRLHNLLKDAEKETEDTKTSLTKKIL